MRERNLYRISICLFVIFISIKVESQPGFGYKAALEEIKATGFYKIDLPPQVVAKCKPGIEDIRIFDDEGNQVSYILKNDLSVFKKENLTEFPIVKNSKETDKQTHIILQNTSDKVVSNLLLLIKNMDAYRAFSVSGSEDSTHWFIIKDNIYLENAFNDDGENTIKALSFPKSNYKYFQLTILGENLLPFNIIRAGIYKEDVVYGKYIEIPKAAVSQKDSSNKKSYVLLQFDDSYQIDEIIIDAEGTKYFKRNFSIGGNGKNDDNLLRDAYISSDSANSFTLNSKGKQLYMIINNEDNIPLKVKKVQAFQLNISLLTYLQSGKKYYVSFGDSAMQAPKYDLHFFSDSVEKKPTQIGLKNIEINKAVVPHARSSWFNDHPLILWIIIIVVLLGLTFFTFKMIGEVNKKKESNQ